LLMDGIIKYEILVNSCTIFMKFYHLVNNHYGGIDTWMSCNYKRNLPLIYKRSMLNDTLKEH
jgi:hypothetical protein